MARKRNRLDPPDSDAMTEERLFWFLAANYLAWAVGLLAEDKVEKLNTLTAEHGGGDWRQHARETLGIDDAFVRLAYALCREYRDGPAPALGFILRGLGCPETDERLREILG